MKIDYTEKEIDMIRGKLLIPTVTQKEAHAFLQYVSVLEALVEEASDDDFFGTEGWRHKVGWDS